MPDMNQLIQNIQIVQKFAENLQCTEPKQTALLETLFERIKTMIDFVYEKSDPEIISTLGQSFNLNKNEMHINHRNGIKRPLNGCDTQNGALNKINEMVNGDNIESHIIEIMSSTVIDCVMLWAKQTENSHLSKIINDTKHQTPTEVDAASTTAATVTVTATDTTVVPATETTRAFSQELSESSLYELISQVLAHKLNQYTNGTMAECTNTDTIMDSSSCNTIAILTAIEKMLTSPLTLQQFENAVQSLADRTIQMDNVNIIEAIINNRIGDETLVVEQLSKILLESEQHDEELIAAIHELYCCEPKLIQTIVNEIKNGGAIGKVVTDTDTDLDTDVDVDVDTDLDHVIEQDIRKAENVVAVAQLKKAIISAVQQTTNDDVNRIITAFEETTHIDEIDETLKLYLLDTISMAKALGLTNCAQNLINAMDSGHQSLSVQLKCDQNTIELLQRVIVMHKLSTNDENRRKSLELLRLDPYTARNDTSLRKLWRSSGACTLSPNKKTKLTDSNQVPLTLIYSGNQLAIEDFLMHREHKSRGAFLICKDGFQAVVPRESSRDVLIGKCAYTMLDENGIRHFEPLHVFSALKLKNVQMFAHRFTSYSRDDDNPKDAKNGLAKSNKTSDNLDTDADSILTMSSTPPHTTTSSLSNDYYSSDGRYKLPTYVPKRKLTTIRPELYFTGKQVNYRRSFYL